LGDLFVVVWTVMEWMVEEGVSERVVTREVSLGTGKRAWDKHMVVIIGYKLKRQSIRCNCISVPQRTRSEPRFMGGTIPS